MFGFKRKEWKHARKTAFNFFGEVVAVVCLVFLIAAAWVSLEISGQKPGEPPAPIEKSRAVTEGAAVEPETLSVELAKPYEPTKPETIPDGTPEIFDDFYEFDRLDELGTAKPGELGPHPTAEVPPDRGSAGLYAMDIASLIPTLAPREPKQALTIVVEKRKHLLTVYRGDDAVKTYRVAVGMKQGDKKRAGDMRTPEGTFPVQNIHNSEHWVHDFGDGNGAIAGAYGPLFIRLHTPPWNGIGIHGTHDPDSLGRNATEGCVRMKNDDLLELAAMIDVGTSVIIR